MKRLLCVLAMTAVMAGCSHPDPLAGRGASDLPPGPLQPVPSTSAPPPTCLVLAASRGATKQATDADFLEITLTNRNDDTCTVHGYPVLTLRDGSGRAVGERAQFRTNGAARYLDLTPGESATATVRFPKTGKCTAGTAKIEVLIPGATEREFIDESHPYCPGWSVTAIHHGSA